MALPRILIPRELEREALDRAAKLAHDAMVRVFGLIQAEIMRRQSYAWAHERALYFQELARLLRASPIRILGIARKIKRANRRSIHFAALARARDPRLAQACKLCGDA